MNTHLEQTGFRGSSTIIAGGAALPLGSSDQAVVGSTVFGDRGQIVGRVLGCGQESAKYPDPQWENRKVCGVLEQLLSDSGPEAVPVTLRTASNVVSDLAIMLRQEIAELHAAIMPVSSTEPGLSARPIVLQGKTTPACPAAAEIMDTAGNLLDLYLHVGEIRRKLGII